MTAPSAHRPDDPLAILVTALLDRARGDADAALATADAAATATLTRARAEADAILDEARAKGAADGEAIVAAQRSRAQQLARTELLVARRVARERARQAARDAVCRLRTHESYPAAILALREQVTTELGPDAVVLELDRGGIVGTVPGRRIEYSLEGLADDVMDRMDADASERWSP